MKNLFIDALKLLLGEGLFGLLIERQEVIDDNAKDGIGWV